MELDRHNSLASLMPLTAITFLKYLLKRKEKEHERIARVLGFKKQENSAYVPTLENEYKNIDCMLPVCFAAVVAFLGALTLLKGPSLIGAGGISLLPDGLSIASPNVRFEKNITTKLFGMPIIGLALVGFCLWSVQNLFHRLSIQELRPTASGPLQPGNGAVAGSQPIHSTLPCPSLDFSVFGAMSEILDFQKFPLPFFMVDSCLLAQIEFRGKNIFAFLFQTGSTETDFL